MELLYENYISKAHSNIIRFYHHYYLSPKSLSFAVFNTQHLHSCPISGAGRNETFVLPTREGYLFFIIARNPQDPHLPIQRYLIIQCFMLLNRGLLCLFFCVVF